MRILNRLRYSARWLTPGLGIKRWLVVQFLGITLLAVGFAVLILEIYRSAPDTWWLPLLSLASLRFLARPLRALIFGSLGVGLVLWGAWGMNRALLAPFTGSGKSVLEAVTSHRRLGRGPSIVVLGGGHGLATLLRGLKVYSHNLTAVVTVADDGGSSGRLRETLGILPPGDIRNCLAALSNDEALLSQLFQYRFADTVDGLAGHSFGNLFISALAEITGSFEQAIAESGRVLSVNGRVLPATLCSVQLVADVLLPTVMQTVRIVGESQIPEAGGKIQRVWLEPDSPPAYPKVLQALLNADVIVVGPGSLYTSILPNLLVPQIVDAVRASKALKIFICNVAAQPGETDGYSAGDHVQAVYAHTRSGLFDIALCNHTVPVDAPPEVAWVSPTIDPNLRIQAHYADLIDPARPWRHSAEKLAKEIYELYTERSSPLVE
ncbi:MAG: YvcK family protein [Anaerolineales bacterium]